MLQFYCGYYTTARPVLLLIKTEKREAPPLQGGSGADGFGCGAFPFCRDAGGRKCGLSGVDGAGGVPVLVRAVQSLRYRTGNITRS